MPHRTQITTPEILQRMILLHAACTQRINQASLDSAKGMSPANTAAYVRDVRQADSIARFLHTPFREDYSSPPPLRGGYTGVFLEEDDKDGFLIEEHRMSSSSPMQGLLNKAIGTRADGWTLIAIKF